MKVLYRADVFGWNMTGLLGKDAKWFFGYSREPNHDSCRGCDNNDTKKSCDGCNDNYSNWKKESKPNYDYAGGL